MFRMKSTPLAPSGDYGSKRLRSTTLAAILVLLVSPSPTLQNPVAVRRSGQAARRAVDSDGVAEVSSAVSASDLEVEKVFFPTANEGDGIGTKTTVVATIGEAVVLECEAGGSPGPTIHWVRHGHRIPQTSSNQQASVLDDQASYEGQSEEGRRLLRLSSTKSRLYLDCVSHEDAGVYQCIAETPTKRIMSTTTLEVVPKARRHRKHHSQNQDSDQHAESSLHTHRGTKNGGRSDCNQRRSMRLAGQTELAQSEPARIYMWTVHRIEIEGTDVQLYCRAAGNPAPKVTWYDRDDNKITGNNADYRLLQNGDLLIHGVTWSERMGLYRCVANNDAGSDFATTFLYPTTE